MAGIKQFPPSMSPAAPTKGPRPDVGRANAPPPRSTLCQGSATPMFAFRLATLWAFILVLCCAPLHLPGVAAQETTTTTVASVTPLATFAASVAMTGHTNIIYGMAMSSDNQTLFSGAADSLVVAWSIANSTKLEARNNEQ
jgi:hypothetical protein